MMNNYKIDVKEILKKEIYIAAKDPNSALNKLENMYVKKKNKEFKDRNMVEVEAAVVEENGTKTGETLIEIETENEKKIREFYEQLKEDEKIIDRLETLLDFIDRKYENKINILKDFASEMKDLIDDYQIFLEDDDVDNEIELDYILNEKL